MNHAESQPTHSSAHTGHHQGQGNAHGHADHQHTPPVNATNQKRIGIVFLMTIGYAVIQAVGGVLSGSLALIADAGHMVSDAIALLLALIAYRIAERAPDAMRTYGFHRVRVLAALVNGAALLLLVVWIIWEAIARLRAPSEILAGPMLLVAIIGLFVNIIGAYVLWRGHPEDGNLRGALLHVIGDLLGSVGAIIAAVGIMLTGWAILDPILSVLVAVLIVRSTWHLVTESVSILLQSVPKGLDIKAAEAEIGALTGIAEVGHFHVWTLADNMRVATIHVTPEPGTDPLTLPELVSRTLRERYTIDHITVQIDPPRQHPHCPLQSCD